ncbi:MAG: class I mannose-6-phosphate isomerase [Clostridiales bacterium]|nr:class I mannose-6-phosphate isomerase [Clostridiales bacterium]
MAIYKLHGYLKKTLWGSENWLLSSNPSITSSIETENGLVNINTVFHEELPVLIKLIEVTDKLSIQVHPNDSTAKSHGYLNGKTESWFILENQADSEILLNFKPLTDNQHIVNSLNNGTIERLCGRYIPSKNNFIHIPSGTIHSILGNLKLLEIQQNSDITYRLYDWNRGRNLDIEKGLESIDISQKGIIIDSFESFESDYYTVKKYSTTDNIILKHHSEFMYFFIIDGELKINDKLFITNESGLSCQESSLNFKGVGTFLIVEFNYE